MRISEIYQSRQGEGLLSGQESVFIRTSGCNLRCGFCDTPFTSWNPEGTHYSISDIVTAALEYTSRHVVLTGGEPMLPSDVVELTRSLREHGFHITIETAGTVFRPAICDLMSISPKLPNSDPEPERAGEWLARHQQIRWQPQVVQQLMELAPYQLKFVVANQGDLAEIDAFLAHLDSFESDRVLLMPEGIDVETLQKRETWLRPICNERGFAFCQRNHIFWYGNRRGT